MNTFTQWASRNKSGLSFVAVLVLVAGGLSYMQGCSIDDLIQTRVPLQMQEAIGAPPKVPVSQYPSWASKWQSHVKKETALIERRIASAEAAFTSELVGIEADGTNLKFVTAELEANRVKSERVRNFVQSLTETGLQMASPAAATFPGGATLLAILAGATGLMFEKPGTSQRVAKEKEASHKKGLEQGKDLSS